MADRLGYCRFCASFNRENNVPYFPAAYHKNNYTTSLSESLNVCTDIKNDLDNKDGDGDMYNAKEESKNIVKNIATIGLESAEEVFHVFHAINSKEGEWMHKGNILCNAINSIHVNLYKVFYDSVFDSLHVYNALSIKMLQDVYSKYCIYYFYIGSRKLNEVMLELLKPTEKIASENCEKLNIYHCSIDATVNPGLSIDDSIGNVVKKLLLHFEKSAKEKNLENLEA